MEPTKPADPTVLKVLTQNPESDAQHFHEDHPHHDPAEEVAHAQQHAVQNIWFFVGFFTLILFAVANYEFAGTKYWWAIFTLGALRIALIAGFFVWLIGHFSFVVRTIIFTVLFFIGMVFLSLWDSTLNRVGNPIALPVDYRKGLPFRTTRPRLLTCR